MSGIAGAGLRLSPRLALPIADALTQPTVASLTKALTALARPQSLPVLQPLTDAALVAVGGGLVEGLALDAVGQGVRAGEAGGATAVLPMKERRSIRVLLLRGDLR